MLNASQGDLMGIDRRKFIGAVAALALPRFALAQSADSVVITAEKSAMALVKGSAKTPVWRFAKDQQVAILRAKQGQVFQGLIENKLDQELWFHWFGVRGDVKAMTINVLPKTTQSFSFIPPDAGTFWFGPLLHASEQRDRGLYGMLIVEEAEALALQDVPLIIDDWLLDDQSQITAVFGKLDMAIADGRMGNWFTANGVFQNKINVDGSKPLRLRVFNAANARTIKLQLKDTEAEILSWDGQPVLPYVLGREALVLAPGQRADVLVRSLRREIVLELEMPEDAVELAFLESDGKVATAPLPTDFRLPANSISPLADLNLARHIPIILQGGAKGGLKSAKFREADLDMRGLLERGLAWAINGIAGIGGPVLFEAKKGETIILDVENQTNFAQPLHLHGHVWQSIELDGLPLGAPTWRDTAVVPASGRMKLALVCDNIGLWPIQSLIAERSDAGLIGAFAVVELP
jgi:FtsP/CotA-like multicopper oxidase with cupredoxin domain